MDKVQHDIGTAITNRMVKLFKGTSNYILLSKNVNMQGWHSPADDDAVAVEGTACVVALGTAAEPDWEFAVVAAAASDGALRQEIASSVADEASEEVPEVVEVTAVVVLFGTLSVVVAEAVVAAVGMMVETTGTT